MKATATHWVTKEKETIPVVEMTTSHLIRWVRYFRKKIRGTVVDPLDTVMNVDADRYIRDTMVTGVAIYDQLKARGIDLYADPDHDLDDALSAAKDWQSIPVVSTVTVNYPDGGTMQFHPTSVSYPVVYGQLGDSASNITITGNAPSEKARKKKLQQDMLKLKAQEQALAKMTAPEPGQAKRKVRIG